MKTFLFFLLLSSALSIRGQQIQSLSQNKILVGKTDDLLQQLSKNSQRARRTTDEEFTIEIEAHTTFTLIINNVQSAEDKNQFTGSVQSKRNSTFVLILHKNVAEGNIILKEEKTAYQFISDIEGTVYLQQIDINKIICVDYDALPSNQRLSSTSDSDSILVPGLNVNALQSLSGSLFVVYLDFDGEYLPSTVWNSGKPIDAAPSGMSDADILQAWEIVSEDYRPFDLNVTTDRNVFNNAQIGKRIRVIITPTDTAYSRAGGIAYIGSFTSLSNEPCWAFTSGAGTGGKNIGEVCSHEIGHTLGLIHDGRNLPDGGHEEYYPGQGDWAPIMGIGYGPHITQFSAGEYNDANNHEDDLNVITTNNGFSFRSDSHANTSAAATLLMIGTSGTVSESQNFGVIEQRSDIDVFSFTTNGGPVNLSINPANYGNLDILAKLVDQNNILITTSNPSGLAAYISTTLDAGKYFIYIDGTGFADPLTGGYSDYGSIGYFSISGTIPFNENEALNNTASLNPIIVFPNPAMDFIKLDLKQSPYTLVNVFLLDAMGNLISKQSDIKSEDKIDISSLTEGIYNLKIVAGNDITHQKIVKY